MSNQLISGEYFYKGRINYFLVKCHIYQGNKQIYNFNNRSDTKVNDSKTLIGFSDNLITTPVFSH